MTRFYAHRPQRRRAAKRDENEPGIIQALEEAYCDVVQLDRPVDLLVGRAGRNYLLEVKAVGRKRYDQPEQDRFLSQWRGQATRVETAAEALAAVGIKEVT